MSARTASAVAIKGSSSFTCFSGLAQLPSLRCLSSSAGANAGTSDRPSLASAVVLAAA